MQRLADQVSAWFVPAVLLAALATFIGWMTFGPEHRPAGAGHRHHRRRPHHRLPLRPGPGHPDRRHGRHRQGRRARHPHQRRRRPSRPHAGSPPSSSTRPAPSPTAGPTARARPAPARPRVRRSARPAWPPPRSAASTRSARPSSTAARDRGLTLRPATDFDALTGHGITAHVDERTVAVGNQAHMTSLGVDTAPLADDAAPRGRGGRHPDVRRRRRRAWPAWSTVADTVKPDVRRGRRPAEGPRPARSGW